MILDIDFEEYNKPPFFPQNLCRGETLSLAVFDDGLFKEINKAVMNLTDQYDLNNIQGALLDRIGKLLCITRSGRGDDVYRSLLKLKQMVNRSNGTVNDIINVILIMYQATRVSVEPDYPAGVTISHNGTDQLFTFTDAFFADGNQIVFNDGEDMLFASPDAELDDLISQAIPAGISYSITKENENGTETD
jgi:hypothetical protein